VQKLPALQQHWQVRIRVAWGAVKEQLLHRWAHSVVRAWQVGCLLYGRSRSAVWKYLAYVMWEQHQLPFCNPCASCNALHCAALYCLPRSYEHLEWLLSYAMDTDSPPTDICVLL
jgi:hypothetical protein